MSLTRKKVLGLGSIILTIALLFSMMTVFADETEGTSSTEETGVWTEVAPMNVGRVYFGSAVLNGKIYIVGGINGSTNLNSVEEYDPETDTWTTKASMNNTSGRCVISVINGKIYAIGTSDIAFHAVEEYDPETDIWTTKASMSHTRSDFSVATVNGKMYVIGGGSGNLVKEVEEYDPETDIWTTKASMANGRFYPSTTVVDGKIYVFGGYSGTAYFSSTEEYDPETDTWTTKASMVNGRAYNGATVIDEKIYAIGGSNLSSQLNSVEKYNPATDTWTTMASMNTDRVALQATVLNGKIYAIGGKNSIDGELNSVEEYDPTTNEWTAVASMDNARSFHQIAVLDGKIYVMGGSFYTDIVEVYTPESTTPTTPTSPTNLTATAGDTQVDLSWTGVDGATSYTVKRSTTSGGPYETIATGVTDTAYTDTDVTNGTTYYYVVTAITANGESENSNEASATPQAGTTPPDETGNALLEITMTDGSLKEYELTMAEVNDFIDWFDAKSEGTGDAYYIFDKDYNKGPFSSRKDYLVFDKIQNFEVNQYE